MGQTATAYAELRRSAEARVRDRLPADRTRILVGTATCGRAAGALEVVDILSRELPARAIQASVVQVGCMGYCFAEPTVVVSRPGWPSICYGYVTPGVMARIIESFLLGDDPCLEFVLGALEENDLVPGLKDLPRAMHEKKVLLENCGLIDPLDIDQYLAAGGYEGLAKALAMQPGEVIAEVESARLRGRGGAGFPTALKWGLVNKDPAPTKYLICNADEGDPGAFMDRAILESDPQSVIEGAAIAGYAVGAHEGYIYVRAEYPLAVKHVKEAVRQASDLGLLGDNMLGSGFSFRMKVVQGAGAFVCGEETALLRSLEGERGMPRHRPPYPAESGLWGRPTIIDNVKTLAAVPRILSRGGRWHAGIGTAGSKGTAVFTLAGKVTNTGLVEVPMGTTLRQLVFDVGGGIPGGKKFKAVQIGGPSGGCLPESLLDTPIDFDSLAASGAIMGSGGLVVMDDSNCMVDAARYFLDFTQKESCGKCTFCRLGTRQMLLILDRIVRGQGEPRDMEVLAGLAADVKSGSLCNLGRTAPNPVLTTIRYFADEYRAHILEKRCPALACKDLIAYYILPEKCERSCDACVGSCPVEGISSDKKRVKVIDQVKCVKCGSCVDACPPQYKAVKVFSPPGALPGTK